MKLRTDLMKVFVLLAQKKTALQASIKYEYNPRASFLLHSVLLSPECYHLKLELVSEYSARSLCCAVRNFICQSVRSHCSQLP